MSEFRRLPRDPVTGVEGGEPSARPISTMSSRELEEEIRRTRARMTRSLNEVESRVSPAHLKREMQESIQGAVDEVRNHFHPKRMAKRAGDTMVDTIKENPIPALIAGVSLGYLIVKATGDDRGRVPYREPERWPYASRPGSTDPYMRSYGHGEGFAAEESMYRSTSEHTERDTGRAEQLRERAADSIESTRERAGHAAERIREETSDALHSAEERARRAASAARDRARRAAEMTQDRAMRTGRKVQHGARAAESELVRFVNDNPLVAGAVAIGLGALIGSLLPATETENRMIGDKRDALMDRAKEAGDEARRGVRNVAAAASGELRDSASRIAETAKSEAREVRKKVAHSGNGNELDERDDEFGL